MPSSSSSTPTLSVASSRRRPTMRRGVDNPTEIFLRVEFNSAEDAELCQDKVRG